MADCDLETWNRSRYIHIGMISVGSMLVMATCMCSCTCVVFLNLFVRFMRHARVSDACAWVTVATVWIFYVLAYGVYVHF